MDKRFVTIKTHYSPTEARLEKGRLEAEGIEAFLADEETIAMDWLLNGAIGGIKLQVAEENADRALEVLGFPLAERVERDGSDSNENPTGPAELSWTCEECGQAVSHDLDYCPKCDQGSECQDDDPHETPLQAAKRKPEAEEENLAEELATRAFRVAVVGLFLICLLFLPHLYSLYLLFRYFGREDEVKRETKQLVLATLAIDGFVLAIWLWLFLGVFH
jgi:hypothetical protein